MEQQSFQYYIDQYTTGRLSKEEWITLRTLMQDPQHIEELRAIMDQQLQESEKGGYTAVTEASLNALLSAINTEKAGEPVTQRPTHRIRVFFRYAAAIIILAGAGIYLYQAREKPKAGLAKQDSAITATITPGKNKAVLTLSDGRSIALDSAANGILAQQGNTAVTKSANGQIRYEVTGTAPGTVMMNTMVTPRGGQYQLTLPDGSQVWLNAASSVTYPTAFTGNERHIKITGEAYLEVARDKTKPFFADIDGQSTVQVLGTSFNSNSYADDGEIKTTLIEGSVKITNGPQQDQTVILQPGQQASIALTPNAGTAAIRVHPADIRQVLAWKNGLFDFSGRSFASLMKDLERWYDIDVKYENGIPPFKLKGKMDRGVQLDDWMRFMKDYGLTATLKGRTLTIAAH